jgi:rhodanese-related sulfurtransferase
VKTLSDMGLDRVSHIEVGFHGWKAAGHPVVTYEEWRTTRTT